MNIRTSIILFLALTLFSGIVRGAQPYPTGYKAPEPAAWQAALERSRAPLAAKVAGRAAPAAATVDFQWLPNVGYQTFGNCGAWPGAYYAKTYYEAREHGWVRPSTGVDPEHVMSVAFPYGLEYMPSYEGSSPDYIAGVLNRYGTTTWAERPESSGYREPTEAEWRFAAQYRNENWYALNIDTPEERATAKALIAGGDPIGSGWGTTTENIFAYEGGNGAGISNDVLYAFVGEGIIGHAITIVGYDDDKQYSVDGETRHGAWLIVNQWGTDWGVIGEPGGTRGFMWIAYDLLHSGIVYEDRIAYQPRDFFVYEMNAGMAAYVDVTLVYGDPAVPIATIPLFYVRRLATYLGTIAEDITDYHDQLNSGWNWRLELYHVSSTNAGAAPWPPVVNAAHLEMEGSDPVNFSGMPLYAGPSITTTHVDQPPNVRDDNLFRGLNQCNYGQGEWVDWNSDGADDLFIGGSSNLNEWYQGIYHPQYALVFMKQADGTYLKTNPGINTFNGTSQLGDFNRDGRPDFLTCREDGSSPVLLRLYLNDGDGGVILREVAAPASYANLMAAADFNNDGATDFVLSGQRYENSAYIPETTFWTNDGAGYFAPMSFTLPVRSIRLVRWADFNRDGWQDVVIDGMVYGNVGGTSFVEACALPSEPWAVAIDDFNRDGTSDIALLADEQTIMLRNDGAFAFTAVNTLDGFVAYDQNPHAAFWGDFDADGRLDYIQHGLQGLGVFVRAPREVQFFRQKSDGSFDRPGLVFPPLSSGIVNGADMDGDNDLDLFVAGQQTVPYPETPPPSMPWNSAGYRNALDEFLGTVHNDPPAAPGGLHAQAADATGVDLSWNAPADAQELSPFSSGYRLRVGTTPGGQQIVSDAIIHDRSPLWLAPGTPGRRLRGLAAGQYYWAVRAVDSSHVPGPWSSENTFTIGTPGSPGDINRDGVVDAADMRGIKKMLAGEIPEDVTAADADANGRVDGDDEWAVRARVLGRNWGSGTIGVEGGTIEFSGFELRIRSGSFMESVDMQVERSFRNPMQSTATPPAYRIMGLPADFNLPVEAMIYAPGFNGGAQFLLGSEGFRRSSGRVELGWSTLVALPAGGGWYRTEIPPPHGGAREAARRQNANEPIQLALEEVVLTTNPRWRLTIPVRHLGSEARIYAALNAAHDKFLAAPFGFSYADRTSWPMDIIFRPMDPDSDGGHVSSKWGVNSSYIEVNTKFLDNPNGLGDDPSLEVLVGHEFFHFVQSLYDPRSGFIQAISASYHYWVDEMTASWAETQFTPDPNYVPSVSRVNKDAPLAGLPRADFSFTNTSSSQLRDWGYGLAPLWKYLVDKHGIGITLRTYQAIDAGTMPIPAISTALFTGAPNSQSWLADFSGDWLDDEKLFKYDGHLLVPAKDKQFPAFAEGDHTINLTSPGRLATHHFIATPPFETRGFVVGPLLPAQTLLADAGTKIMLRLKDPSGGAFLHVSALDNQDPSITFTPTFAPAEVQRVDIPGTLQLAQRNSFIAATVTSIVGDRVITPQMDIYVLYNKTLPLSAADVGQQQIDGGRFPTYSVTATLGVKDTGGIEDLSLGSGFQSALFGVAWNTTPQNFQFDVDIDLTSGTAYSYMWFGNRYDLTLQNTRYKFFRRNRELTHTYLEQEVTSTSFVLPVDPAKNYQLYDVVILADLKQEVYAPNPGPGDPWILISTDVSTWDIPATSAFLFIGDRNWEEPEEDPFVPRTGDDEVGRPGTAPLKFRTPTPTRQHVGT